MIDYLKNPEVIFILFSIILCFLLAFKKKLIINFIFSSITLILGVGLIVCNLLKIDLPKVGPLSVELLCDIICAIIVIIIVLTLFKKETKEDLLKETINSLDKKVFAYLDEKGNLLYYTNNFYDELGLEENEKFINKIKELYIDNLKVDYNELLNEYKDEKNKEFKVTFILNTDSLENEYSFNIKKVVIEKNDKVLGYVLLLIETIKKENIDGFSLVIDELDTPYAYYNDDSRSVVYTINKKFKDLLGIKGRTVTYSELRRLVFTEDLSVFDSASSELASNNTYCYRLKTSNGYKMFSEVKLTKDNHVTSVITLVDNKFDKFIDKVDMEKAIDALIYNKRSFGGIIISLNSFIDVFNKYGANVAKELLNKYVDFVKSEVLKENDLVCKISDIEYLLLFKDVNVVDSIVRDVKNNISVLTHYEFNYDEELIETNNTLGIVYSNEFITNANDFMKALYTALSYANNEEYGEIYSIYNSSIKNNKLVKEDVSGLNEEYSFENIKISLDNSFLDDDDEL